MAIKHTLAYTRKIIPNSGETFGALLRDKDLNLVRNGAIGYMYTISARPKPEKSCVRDFNLETLEVGERTEVMDADSGGWASVHFALKVAEDFYILFFSSEGLSVPNKRGIRAAWSSTPNGKFTQYSTSEFEIVPEGWEGTAIEQDVGARKIAENNQYIYYWILYSDINYYTTPNSYSGWYKIKVDKINKTVTYISRYENNPLTNVVLYPYVDNRTGGSNPQTKIGDYYLMYWSARSNDSDNTDTNHPRQVGFAASKDSLFHSIDYIYSVGCVVEGERYMEKFDYYLNNKKQLVLISESVFKDAADGSQYGVVARVYNLEDFLLTRLRSVKNCFIKHEGIIKEIGKIVTRKEKDLLNIEKLKMYEKY